MEIPEHIDADVSEMQVGDTLRLADVPADRGRHVPGRPRGDGARLCLGADGLRGARGRGRGGRGGRRAARGRGGSGGERARRPPRREAEARRERRGVATCGSCVGASRPRRSTCSWRASATRAGSTSGRGTTSAGSSSTSLRAVTAARSARSSPDSLAETRVDDLRLALLKPETYMNESGPLARRGRALLQGRARRAARRPRRRRPRARPAAGEAGRRARRPQRAPLDRAGARLAGLPAPADRRRAARPRRSPRASPTTCCRRSSPRRTSTRWSLARRTRSRRSPARASSRRSLATTRAWAT